MSFFFVGSLCVCTYVTKASALRCTYPPKKLCCSGKYGGEIGKKSAPVFPGSRQKKKINGNAFWPSPFFFPFICHVVVCSRRRKRAGGRRKMFLFSYFSKKKEGREGRGRRERGRRKRDSKAETHGPKFPKSKYSEMSTLKIHVSEMVL